MSGQGVRKVAACLRNRGADFRRKPRTQIGLEWCRFCGYQIALHEKIASEEPWLNPQLAPVPPTEQA